jgi:hypothetical protein
MMVSNHGRTTELSEIDRLHIARKNTTRRYDDKIKGSSVLRIAFFCTNGASEVLNLVAQPAVWGKDVPQSNSIDRAGFLNLATSNSAAACSL